MPADRGVDRQQPARPLCGCQPGVGGLAEIDPADVAERARVAGLDRDLLAGHQDDPVLRGDGGKLGVVTDRVVIGDREEVETLPDREPGQLGHGHRTVRVHRMSVQVARQPAAARAGRQLAAGRAVRQRGQRVGERLRG